MTVFKRAVDAFEDQMASDDNHPDDIVRAILEAVKTPTPSLSMIGRNAVLGCNASPYSDYSVSVGKGFSAMIGAILDGEE